MLFYMHSKFQVWDFFSETNISFLAEYKGVLAINAFDPLCLKMMKDFILAGAKGRVVHHKGSSEVSRSWLEDEFLSLSLFGNSDSFMIHQAQDLTAELVESIGKLSLEDRFILLSFEAEGAGWKKLLKESKIDVLQVEAPRFWESNKLLEFTASLLRLPLSHEAKAWILESLENNFGVFYNSCSLIKLNYPEAKEVSAKEIKELLSQEKLDQFLFASLYARKKLTTFFDKLLVLEGDFEKARGLFNFLQSHFVKLADVSYMASKARPNQYEKELQSSSKLWKQEEVMRELSRFNEWEILCKKKDSRIWHELRKSSLRG
jgi:DNA polymerase III delta subunit